VQVAALRWDVLPSKGALPTLDKIHNFRINYEWEQSREHNPSRYKRFSIIYAVSEYEITENNQDPKFETMVH
jgi:hypothetical protein